MYKQKIKGLIIISCLLLCVYYSVGLLAENASINDKVQITYTDLDVNHLPEGSTDELPFQISPFFNHTTEDSGTYGNLLIQPLSTFLYQHSLNTSVGTEIVDSDVYAADQFYLLLGYNRMINGRTLVPLYFNWYKDSNLWDSESPQGYYHRINSELESVTEEKYAFDNGLALLAMLTGVGDYSPDVRNLINEQWNALNNNFWDPTNNLYNNSISQTTTKLAQDNLLIAMTLFEIAREAEFNETSLDIDALNDRAILLMETLDSDFYETLGGLHGYWYDDVSNFEKYLLTNALGISALLDWNIAEGFDSESAYVTKAENIYSFLKTNLYNTTQNMYHKKMARNGVGSIDYNLNLLDNAWMLRAVLDLFETTGNIQYYNDALELFLGIENTLYDSANHGYNTTFGPNLDELKTLDSYNMLLSSLTDFKEIYDSAEITLTKNSTYYIYLNSTSFNVTTELNYTMNYEYKTTATQSEWDINVIIADAPIKYILRNEDGDIVNEQFGLTDVDGKYTYLYDLDGLELGTYTLSVLCNKTNYCLEFEDINIQYRSDIYIVKYELLKEKLYQGDKGLINLTLGSLRTDNLTVDVTISGEYFNEEIKYDINVLNFTSTNVLINLSSKINIPIDEQEFEVTLSNNSIQIASEIFTIEVFSGIEVDYIIYNQYLVDFSSLKLTISITNHIPTLDIDTLCVNISGDYFVDLDEHLSQIDALSTKIYELWVEPNSEMPYDIVEFGVNITRSDVSIFYDVLSVNSVPTLECLAISAGSTVLHGSNPQVSVRMMNYNITSQTIVIKSNNKVMWSGKIAPGETVISANLDGKYLNPYDTSEKVYTVVILDAENNIISQKVVYINQEISISDILFFYLLPVLVPIGIIAVFKYKEIENEKRTK